MLYHTKGSDPASINFASGIISVKKNQKNNLIFVVATTRKTFRRPDNNQSTIFYRIRNGLLFYHYVNNDIINGNLSKPSYFDLDSIRQQHMQQKIKKTSKQRWSY
jgi:hypothetical protein